MPSIYNALIKTHHITSRKKVAALTQAARKHDIYALLCSGGSPGIMYVEGVQGGVADWVGEVKVSHSLHLIAHPLNADIFQTQRLRYKDYQLLRRPAEIPPDAFRDRTRGLSSSGLHEVDAVKDFGAEMDRRRVLQWWREAMEFDPPGNRL